jgi:hypothetical protein
MRVILEFFSSCRGDGDDSGSLALVVAAVDIQFYLGDLRRDVPVESRFA